MKTLLLVSLEEGRELPFPFRVKVEKVLRSGEKRGIGLLIGKNERLEIWEDDLEKRRRSYYATPNFSYTLQGIKREREAILLLTERNVQIKADFYSREKESNIARN